MGRQEQGSATSSLLSPKMDEYFVQETPRDHVDSSSIYPELHGVPPYGASLPYVLSEEPVYVNAKQYHAILRRRKLRAKAEIENKSTRDRKPYLHESRHLHALRRARGCGGRFINTKKPHDTSGNAKHEEGNNSIGDYPPLNNFSSEPDHHSSKRIAQSSSSSFDDFKRTKCAEYFKWSCHKGFLSK
ncbi:hypothetical protein ACS0TY_025000 [Phlomoides rotata]